jgi:hypothetical protein
VNEASLLSRSTFSGSPSTTPASNYSILPTRALVTARRLDLAVKWRFFRHIMGGNDRDSERLYRWHIEQRSGHRMAAGVATDRWKRTGDDYVEAACRLVGSMAFGFDPAFPIPIDPDGELLDGSHRTACALAFGLGSVPTERSDRHVWAPHWGYDWFAQKGMHPDDLARTMADWNALTA